MFLFSTSRWQYIRRDQWAAYENIYNYRKMKDFLPDIMIFLCLMKAKVHSSVRISGVVLLSSSSSVTSPVNFFLSKYCIYQDCSFIIVSLTSSEIEPFQIKAGLAPKKTTKKTIWNGFLLFLRLFIVNRLFDYLNLTFNILMQVRCFLK